MKNKRTVGQVFPREGISYEAIVRDDGRRRWTWAVLLHWAGEPICLAHGRLEGDRAVATKAAQASLARMLEAT